MFTLLLLELLMFKVADGVKNFGEYIAWNVKDLFGDDKDPAWAKTPTNEWLPAPKRKLGSSK